jgi:hypothetical protein
LRRQHEGIQFRFHVQHRERFGYTSTGLTPWSHFTRRQGPVQGQSTDWIERTG